MSARQDVFSYLKTNSKAPLNEVLSQFSDVKETTIRRYFFEYQKLTDTTKATTKKAKTPQKKSGKTKEVKKAKKGNLKQQVAEFMKSSKDSTLKELCEAFPTSSKSTLGNYRRQWLKDNEASKKEPIKDLKQSVIDYLEKNPTSNINDLKKVFPEAANKLITIFRSWKNDKSNSENQADSDAKDENKEKPNWLNKQKETIAKQKQIIEQQKSRIATLRNQVPKPGRPKIFDSIKNFIADKLKRR